VAMLFATYMVKPSPFCLLDEIDAALDESNVGRFINMLMEFAASSQFIVITHNKKTVAGANTLLGVTMEESGVSKAVAIRLGSEDESVKMYHER
jgi:chromosome segregation protein